MTNRTQVPIAVVGVSALFPGSTDANGFWKDILAGRDLVTDVPASHWLIEDYYDPDPKAQDKTYSKRGAFLQSIDFDPMEFGVPPTIVPATDSAQILALIVAQKVLEDAAQGQFASMDRERISVLLGVTSAQELLGTMVSRLQKPIWIKTLRESGMPEAEAQAICDAMSKNYVPWQESSFPGLLGNVVAGRIANRFDLRGTNAVTDAACASSLAAMSMGINELELGQSDLVITGGVDTMNDIFMYMCFSKTPALSPTGDCRPFSDAADGTLLGEGMGMIALKRLADAERDGDRVYAVVKGIGSASDGRSKSVYAPVPEGQARALRRTYEVAGYGADTVELVEAHGTGTKAGDAAEFEGLRQVFAEADRKDTQWCALGSVKSQIGHTKAAAGAAGLIKAIFALHHKVLPPTIKVERPNPKLEIEKSAFYLNTQARPWIRSSDHPRRASVSSFGFGGSNFHVALEEYVPTAGANGKPAWKMRTMPTELVLLSGATAAEVAKECRALAEQARQPKAEALAFTARRTQEAFQASSTVRISLIATTPAELAEKCEQAAAAIDRAEGKDFSLPGGTYFSATAGVPGEVAFLYPGQGSQYVGMGADIAMAFDQARAAWDFAADYTFDGTRLSEVVFPRPVFTPEARDAQTAHLTKTEWAQPALGIQSLALGNLLAGLGVKPTCFAGHSFGEVTALHSAGAFDAATFLQIARKRGELMRDAAASVAGAMTAVARTIEEVREALLTAPADVQKQVVIANHNAPKQVVLSGSVTAIETIEAVLAGQGMTAKRLPVATAFHSPLVAGSSVPFAAYLKDAAIVAPSLDVYANGDAAAYPHDAAAVTERLARQLAEAVRFVDVIEAMYARGVRTFIEVGAGSVLSDLVARILGARPHHAIHLDRKGRNGVTSLQEGLGRLSVAGLALDYAAQWTTYAPASDKPIKKPAMVMAISGVNSGKPYPPPGGAKDLPKPNPERAALPPKPVESARIAGPTGAQAVPGSNGVASAHAPVAAKASPAPIASAPHIAASASPLLNGARPMNTPKSGPAVNVLPAPTVSAVGVAPPQQGTWIAAYQEAQRQTAETHAAYQRAMADSHVAFLKTAESSFAGLTALITSASIAQSAPVFAPVAPIRHELPAAITPAVSERLHYASMPIEPREAAPAPGRSTMPVPAMAPVPPAPVAAVTTRHTIPIPASVPVAAAPKVDLQALLIAIVAEKTGYPAEMLTPTMELEADLGIDSIKRVEILSAMRERAPGLPEVKPTELAALRTLGEIASYMGSQSPSAPATSVVAAAASAPVASGPSLGELEALLIAIVAEKTGYPADMLTPTMELEADLGIDSIKRVEILSAMRERAPGLPEVKPTELAALRTLGEIASYMGSQGPKGAASSVQAPPVLSAPNGAGRTIVRLAVREVPSLAIGMALPGILAAAHLVITDDGGGIATALKNAFAGVGVNATVVSEVPPVADAVVFLGGLRQVQSEDAAIAVNREAFRAARAVAANFGNKGGAFVSVQDTGGCFGLHGENTLHAWLGGIAALTRTAAREWPKASLKALDCEVGKRSADAVAAAILTELLQGGTTLEVGLRADGARNTLETVATQAIPQPALVLDAQSVVVVSGGGRGVTAACVIELAKVRKCRIVILGRTALGDISPELTALYTDAELKRAIVARAQKDGRMPKPAEVSNEVAQIQATREVQATLNAISAAGASAKYVVANVQDAASVNHALAAVRAEWGPIRAVIHGAGVLADKLLSEKTDEQFDRVFDTKVRGLRALLDATAADPLSALCLFSSIAARTGNLGQSDYAMANEVLNLVACAEQRRRGDACAVRSIGWGPWEGGMVTPSLKAHFEHMGVALIPLDVGARMLTAELEASGPDTVLVVAGPSGNGPLGSDAPSGSGHNGVEGNMHSTSVELRVQRETHPFLADHRIAGTVVVPVVMALEWMTRGARAGHPGLLVAAVRSLKVLRGIKLDGFDTLAGDKFIIKTRVAGSDRDGVTLAVELRGKNDALHYSAIVELAPTTRRASAPSAEAIAVGALEKWSHGPIYDGTVLFHGPQFQVIGALDGVSKEGLCGTLHGALDLGWGQTNATGSNQDHAWCTDPALLDGGLQLAVLYARHVLGGAALPMALGEYRSISEGLTRGPTRAFIKVKDLRESRAVCNITLVDSNDDVLAELLDLELVLRPDVALQKPASPAPTQVAS